MALRNLPLGERLFFRKDGGKAADPVYSLIFAVSSPFKDFKLAVTGKYDSDLVSGLKDEGSAFFRDLKSKPFRPFSSEC